MKLRDFLEKTNENLLLQDKLGNQLLFDETDRAFTHTPYLDFCKRKGIERVLDTEEFYVGVALITNPESTGKVSKAVLKIYIHNKIFRKGTDGMKPGKEEKE